MHKNGLAILPAMLESHRPIDVVVLMLGTNDLKHRFQAPVVEIAESVGTLVHAIRHSYTGPGEAQPAVLLVAPAADPRGGLPRRDLRGRRRSSRSGWPRPTPRWRSGTAAGFLDAGQVIVSSPLDGVHFDAAEHGKLGRAVAAALKAMML